MISDELLAFLEGGNSLSVGTRDAQLLPECARAIGLRVWNDRRHLSLFIPEGPGRRTLENLRDNGKLAIGVSFPPDHRTLQIKGQLVAMEAATSEDSAFVNQYVTQLAAVLDTVGLPVHIVERVNRHPCQRVDVLVQELYRQTPGPGAGSALDGRGP